VFGAKLTSSPDVQVRRIAADGLLRLISISEYLEDELRLKLRPVWTQKVEMLLTCAEVVKEAPKGLHDSDAVVRTMSTDAIRVCAQVLLTQFLRPPDDKKEEATAVKDFPPAQINAIKEILKAFETAGPRLVDALKDTNVEVRLGVVQTLERLSDIRYRLAEESVNVGALGKPAKREGLMPPQASDPLSNFAKGDWRAVARLLDDPEVRVRRSAVYFLEFFPEARPGAVPDLTRALTDPDRFVRWGAARGLGTFSKTYRPQDAVTAVPALAKLLFDNDFAVRVAAAATLESLGVHAEAAAPELVRAVNFGDVENRVAILYVVQSVGPERMKAAIGSVTEAAEHVDPRVRRAATETLGKFGDLARNKNTIDVIRRALGDDDQEVRINASEALLQILDAGSSGKE
jgi:HEAT repeat protein